MEFEDDDEIACRLCGQAFRVLSRVHLIRLHGFNSGSAIQDYKLRYGLKTVRCPAVERKRLRSYVAYLESIGRRWTKERVVAEIRRHVAAGKPLNAGKVAREHGYALRDAGERLFGNWNNALKAAGLDPWTISARHFWTKGRILQELRRIAAQGGRHGPGAIASGDHAALYAAASELFGTWHGALRAAGLRPIRADRRKWSRSLILGEIRARLRRGLPVTAKVLQREEPTLYHYFRSVVGKSLSAVLQDMGLRGTAIAWTKPLLLRELRHFHLKGRSRLPGVTRDALYQAARDYFGSWGNALKSAGVRLARRLPRRWTKEDVLRSIRRRAREGKSLAWDVVLRDDRGLYKAARRSLGKPWREVIREMGYDSGSSKLRWTRERVLEEVRALAKSGKLSPGVTQQKLEMAAWRRFGSLAKARALALRSA